MSRSAIALVATLLGLPLTTAAERQDSSAAVYYVADRAANAKDEAQALTAYRRKFNVVTPGKNERYTPPKVVTFTYPRTSPGGTLLPNGTVRFAAIVTPEGRITKPIVLDAPHDYLGLSVAGVLSAWRCKPAMLNGAPVAAIMIYELDVQRPGASRNPRNDPGLGHLPSQDR